MAYLFAPQYLTQLQQALESFQGREDGITKIRENIRALEESH